MAGFFDNVTGRQKVVLIFGGFVLLIVTASAFPEAYATVLESIMDGIGLIAQFLRDLGGST